MARTLEDFIRKLGEFEQDLQRLLPQYIAKAGRAYLVARKEEIMKRGVGSYSRKKYNASWLKGKELTSAGLSFLEAKMDKKEKTNWAGLRQAEGLQISYVDLYYSGHMWNSTIVSKKQVSALTYYVVIAGRSKKAQAKLDANRERYGDFLKPTEEDMMKMFNDLGKNVSSLLKRKLR